MSNTAITAPAPQDHSDVVGGSSAAMRLGCPASIRLQRKLRAVEKEDRKHKLAASVASLNLATPEDLERMRQAVEEFQAPKEKTSTYAEEGTALHLAVAHILEKDIDVHDVVGMTFNEDGPLGGTLMTYDLVNECLVPAITMLYDFLDRVEAEDGGLAVMYLEKRCQMPGIPGAFGTCDLIIKTAKRTIVWDWKFGGGVPVSAFKNAQLRFYARAGMETCPEMFEIGNPEWRVDCCIAQPRISEEPGIWSTTVADLEEYRLDLVDAIDEGLHDAEPLMAVGTWCRFADCKVICPLHAGAMAQFSEKMAELQGVTLPAAPIPEMPMHELLAALLDAADIVEDLAGEARKSAKKYLEDGGEIEGWMLTPKKSSGREYLDEAAAAKWLVANDIAPDDLYEPRALRSPAQHEKLLKLNKSLAKKDKVKSKDELAAMPTEMPVEIATPKPSSGANLARRVEGRAEIQSTAAVLSTIANRLLAHQGA